jgi:ketosteroid isomerase-like protein
LADFGFGEAIYAVWPLRDTPWMPEESTTPDLVELVRAGFEAYSRGDFDGTARFFAPDAVWDMKGGETFEGIAAIRGLMEEFYRQFESFAVEIDEVRDLGGEVVIAVNTMRGYPLGSTVEVRQRGLFVYEHKAGLAVRCTGYTDIAEGRAAAERLAESPPTSSARPL